MLKTVRNEDNFKKKKNEIINNRAAGIRVKMENYVIIAKKDMKINM